MPIPSRILSSFLASLALLLCLAGCGEDATLLLIEPDNGAGLLAPVAGPGSMTGTVFLGPGGALLGRDVPDPAGLTPAAGAMVVALELGLQTATDADGRFVLHGIPTGPVMLRIQVPGLAPVDAPATSFGSGVVTTLDSTPVTREAAVARVLEYVRSSRFEDPRGVLVLGPQNVLPAGAIVGVGIDDESVTGVPEGSLRRARPTPQWFFFLDEGWPAKFVHEVDFVTVDAMSGEMASEQHRSWPVLAGNRFYSILEDDLLLPDVVQDPTVVGPTVLPQPTAVAPLTAARASVPLPLHVDHCAGAGRTFAMIAQGDTDSSTDANVENIRGVFGKYGIPPAALITPYHPGRQPPVGGDDRTKEPLVMAFRESCSLTTECDTLFFYFAGHGSRQGVIVDGVTINWSAFDFSQCRACHVIIWLDCCFSEASWSRSGKGPQFLGLDRPGRKWIILAAAQRYGPKEGNAVYVRPLDPGLPTGGVYTNTMLGILPSTGSVDSLSNLETAHRNTRTEMDRFVTINPFIQSKVRKQKPMLQVDWALGETCAPPEPYVGIPQPRPEVPYRISPEMLAVELTSDGPCPFPVGTYTISNAGADTMIVQLSPPGHTVTARFIEAVDVFVDGNTASIDTGADVQVEVRYVACDERVPFTARILHFITSASSDFTPKTQAVTVRGNLALGGPGTGGPGTGGPQQPVPRLSFLAIDTASIPADGASQCTVTVAVSDDAGDPLPGVQVSVTASLGTLDPMADVDPTAFGVQLRTDASGVARVQLTSIESPVTVTSDVRAFLGAESLARSVMFTAVALPPAPEPACLLEGTWDCSFTVTPGGDPCGHDPSVNLDSSTLTITDLGGGQLRITGSHSQSIQSQGATGDCELLSIARGTGTVAGLPGIDVEYLDLISRDGATLTGHYALGASGALPGGCEILYTMIGTRAP